MTPPPEAMPRFSNYWSNHWQKFDPMTLCPAFTSLYEAVQSKEVLAHTMHRLDRK